MDIVRINCTKCGRFFESNGFITLCPVCYKKDQDDFERIRQYLYEHPHAKVFQVSTDLELPVSQIKRYLREERLEILEKDNLFLKCEACGKSIRSGVYCDECSRKYDNNIRSVYTGNLNSGRTTSQQIRFLPGR